MTSFTQKFWKNRTDPTLDPGTDPAIDAAELNRIETGITDAVGGVNTNSDAIAAETSAREAMTSADLVDAPTGSPSDGQAWVRDGAAWMFTDVETPTGAQAKADSAQSAAELAAATDATTKANAARDAAEAASDTVGSAAAAQAASQPVDADLTAIAALDSSTAGAIASDGAGWIKKTYAQLKTALSLTATDVGLGNVTNDAQLKASQLDTDGALAADADTRVPSQKAVKTYVDALGGSLPAPGATYALDAYANMAIGALMPNIVPGTFISGNAEGNTFIGFNNGQALTTGQHNTGIGSVAFQALTSGTGNTAIGEGALYSVTTGGPNTAIGPNSLEFNISGSHNTAVGNASLRYATGGSNTAVGDGALGVQTVASGNTAVGYAALGAADPGGFNVAVGWEALYNSTGQQNVAVGYSAGTNNSSAATCIAIGYAAMGGSAVTTGNDNIAIGANSMLAVTSGHDNVAIGLNALTTCATGANNVCVGENSLNLATGSNTVAIGVNAGFKQSTGLNNTFVGYSAGYTATAANATTTAQGQTCIGRESGLGSVTQANYITCLGYRTLVSAVGGVAIGVDSGGAGAASVTSNHIALGTANHILDVIGSANIAGSGKTLGFYGVTAISRAVLATGASHTVDDVITALQNLGLVSQS